MLSSELIPSPIPERWHSRVKAKDLYRELRSRRRVLKEEYKSSKRVSKTLFRVMVFSMLWSFLGAAFTLLVMGITGSPEIGQILGLIFAPGIFIAVLLAWVSVPYDRKAKKARERAQRYVVLGVVSQALARDCSRVDVFFDFREAKKATEPYRTSKSPHSGATKRYYNYQWLRFDTNSSDGMKFLLASRRKVKMKGSHVARDDLVCHFKFSFRVEENEKTTHKHLNELEKTILAQVKTPFRKMLAKERLDKQHNLSIAIDYPSADVLRFTLKMWFPKDSFERTSGLTTVLSTFNVCIRDKYPEHTGYTLYPLKQLA